MSVPPTADAPVTLPQAVQLNSVYPNPFNGMTVVGFSLPQASTVKLALYDLAGRRVVERSLGMQPAGEHQAAFTAAGDAGMFSSGYYFLSVETEFGSAKRGVILLK